MNTTYPEVNYLCRLAVQAGRTMRRNFRLGMERKIKDDDTPVTETDISINDYVVDSIRHDYPHVRVIGEEGGYDVAGAEYSLVLDPVDGTNAFSRGIPISTFVAAVLREHQPLAAVIYDPFMDRMWQAEKGQGTLLNNRPAKVSAHASLHLAHVCMPWWKGAAFNLGKVCEKLLDAGATWGNPLTIAYYGGLLASGEQDATVFPSRKGLETAAMQLIAEEAGGKVTDIHGNPMRYGPNAEIEGHIISNGLLHDELVEIVASCQS